MRETNWGEQTQRSLENFPIGTQKMPWPILREMIFIKRCAAAVNARLGLIDADISHAIQETADELLLKEPKELFPLVIYQTGSGTQSHMNVNEVIASLASQRLGRAVHPNDHVNRSQSSNDVFPTALHLSAIEALTEKVLPALQEVTKTLSTLETENEGIVKTARTHLQDAVPMLFSQEISGWRSQLEECADMIRLSLTKLTYLAIGATAVGTGINSHPEYADQMVKEINSYRQKTFHRAPNFFGAISSKEALSFAHGALRTVAACSLKIANDIRLLASGPRCGLGEIILPANEAGSSIMPGKVNPTQAEALSMVCLRVMGNDTAVSFAASQGHLQLNTYMPLIGHCFLESAELLSEALVSFDLRCLQGLKADRDRMHALFEKSLMLVTALSPRIGYENAAAIAHEALHTGVTLREAALQSGKVSEEEFDEWVQPEVMVHP